MLGPLQDLANLSGRSRTDIIVFADDAIWPPCFCHMYWPASKTRNLGGVGTSQRVQAVGRRNDSLGSPRHFSPYHSKHRNIFYWVPVFMAGYLVYPGVCLVGFVWGG